MGTMMKILYQNKMDDAEVRNAQKFDKSIYFILTKNSSWKILLCSSHSNFVRKIQKISDQFSVSCKLSSIKYTHNIVTKFIPQKSKQSTQNYRFHTVHIHNVHSAVVIGAVDSVVHIEVPAVVHPNFRAG